MYILFKIGYNIITSIEFYDMILESYENISILLKTLIWIHEISIDLNILEICLIKKTLFQVYFLN